MFGFKSDEERLFERIDKADTEVARFRSLGLPNSVMEDFAKTLRTTSIAYKGLARKTMVAVIKSGNQRMLRKWNVMWKEMETGRLHPRELLAFYMALTGRKRIE